MIPSAVPRVGYILPVYDPATSGHFFHIYELVKRVMVGGYLDMFVVMEKAASPPTDLGVPCTVQRFSFPPLRFLELVAILFRQRLRGCRSFYVHYSFYGGLAAWLVTRILGGRAYYWNSGLPWHYRRGWFEEAVFRFVLRHTILVTDPPGLAEQYRNRYGLRPGMIRIVPHFITIERFTKRDPEYNYDRRNIRKGLGLPSETRIILFVHRLSRRKGAHLIPEVAEEVTKARKDVIFLVVGAGPEKQNLESRIQNLGLARYVRMVGEVPHRDIGAYFQVADVFFLPSEEEGFPHVLLEAAAMGLPFVASDVGGIRELVPRRLHHLVVPAGDGAAMAGKMVELLGTNAAELSRLGRELRSWAANHDVEAVRPKFVGLFRNDADGKPR